MKTKKTFMVLALALASALMLPAARASEHDQATKLTFNQSVQIPGRVLPAGTYWFVLADTDDARNVVQVFNSDRTMLYATVFTVDARRSDTVIGDTAITFAARGAMQPEAMVLWFYPGRNSGHEFLYPDADQKELAQVKRHTVIAATTSRPKTNNTSSRKATRSVLLRLPPSAPAGGVTPTPPASVSPDFFVPTSYPPLLGRVAHTIVPHVTPAKYIFAHSG